MKFVLRSLYSILLFFAGVAHFTKFEGFKRIVPDIVPKKDFIVKFTGVLEIAFAFLLWIKKGQTVTGKLLASFMIAVFPANLNMAIKRIPFKPGEEANPTLLWARIPLQIPLIIGALKLGRK